MDCLFVELFDHLATLMLVVWIVVLVWDVVVLETVVMLRSHQCCQSCSHMAGQLLVDYAFPHDSC